MSNIAPHESWKVVDSTKLKTFTECPRAYFYEYILGWRGDSPSIHLEFGTAWHLAMEYLLTHDYSAQSIQVAWALLNEHYRKFFGPHMDEVNAPKNPSNALTALMDYCARYKAEDAAQKVLYTEVAGTVMMDETHIIHFRMDSIIEKNGMIGSREHKTGSTLSRQWIDQWSLAIQTWVYNHVLYSMFPKEKVSGVEINGTFLQKKENKFQRVPARRSLQMMQVGYWNTLNWLLDLEREMERLDEAKEEDPIMFCFPQNPSHCTSYFGCRYMDFCMSWPNPLQRCDEVPLGMKVEHWNPATDATLPPPKAVFEV